MDVRTTVLEHRSLWRSLWIGLAAVGFGSAMMVGAACEREGPAERTGEAIDEAAENTADAVDGAVDNTGN